MQSVGSLKDVSALFTPCDKQKSRFGDLNRTCPQPRARMLQGLPGMEAGDIVMQGKKQTGEKNNTSDINSLHF